MRRAHDAIKADAYIEDKTTGELHRPHHMDLKSGMYRGRQVMKVRIVSNGPLCSGYSIGWGIPAFSA